MSGELTEAETAEVRRRQRVRARLMAILLGALVILLFGVSIAKMTINR